MWENHPLNKKVNHNSYFPGSSLLNLNILAKFKPERVSYVSMFTCDCLMSILECMCRRAEMKRIGFKMRWKFDFCLRMKKSIWGLSNPMIKGDDIFSNIGKFYSINSNSYGNFLKSQLTIRHLSGLTLIVLQVDWTLHKTSDNQQWNPSIVWVSFDVYWIRCHSSHKQPNQWDDIVSGKFIRVNEIGHAILEVLKEIKEKNSKMESWSWKNKLKILNKIRMNKTETLHKLDSETIF